MIPHYTEILKILQESYPDYLDAIDKDASARLNLPIRSKKWEPDGLVHASQLESCPKKAAIEILQLLERQRPPLDQRQLMEAGTQMGNVYYESLVWYIAHNKLTHKIQDEVELASSDPSMPLAGRPDALILGHNYAFPVEVKWTEAWQYSGLSTYHLTQLVAYMILLRQKNRSWGTYGFIVTLYPGKMAPQAFKVWTVARREDYFFLINDDGETIKLPYFPGSEYESYLTIQNINDFITEIGAWVQELHKGPASDTIVNNSPFESPFTNWQCGKKVKPEVYIRRTERGGVVYNPGDQKPDTGTFIPQCPAFVYCWASRLEKANLDPALPLPSPIKLVFDGTDIEFDPHQEQRF